MIEIWILTLESVTTHERTEQAIWFKKKKPGQTKNEDKLAAHLAI